MFLRGATRFLATHRPIIYGEFNSYWIKRFGGSFLDVVGIVKPLDYRFFKETNHGQFVETSRPAEGDENVLLAPSDTDDATLRRLGVVSAQDFTGHV